MSRGIETMNSQLLSAPAANADRLSEQLVDRLPQIGLTETASGWDSYEVWRRFIKDARDRRRPDPK
jgi:hypothetical protein